MSPSAGKKGAKTGAQPPPSRITMVSRRHCATSQRRACGKMWPWSRAHRAAASGGDTWRCALPCAGSKEEGRERHRLTQAQASAWLGQGGEGEWGGKAESVKAAEEGDRKVSEGGRAELVGKGVEEVEGAAAAGGRLAEAAAAAAAQAPGFWPPASM